MVAVHACKHVLSRAEGGKVRYRYYVSRDLQHSGDASITDGWRLPAREIEPLVRARIIALLNDPLELLARSDAQMPSPDEFHAIFARGKAAAAKLCGPRAPGAELLRDLVAEVRLGGEQVGIMLDARKLATLLEIELPDELLTLTVAARLKRNGCVMKLITPGGRAALPTVDRTLVRTIIRARTWWGQLCADPTLTVTGIAAREQVTKSYVTRIVRLAFLAPDILGAVLDGTAPAHLTADRLTLGDVIPAGWNDQRRAFGIAARN